MDEEALVPPQQCNGFIIPIILASCFFIRWFQRKHTVTKVVIDEENPYIESDDNVFIRVVE